MALATSMNNLSDGIRNLIEVEAERIREEAIQRAVADFERNLRDRVAHASLKVSDYYSIREREGEILITVRHQGATTNPQDMKAPRP